MRSALKCYACLTVREDLAKAQLTELGYDSTQVLDPTLLLSKEEWLSVFFIYKSRAFFIGVFGRMEQ